MIEQRWGITIPLSDLPLRDQIPLFAQAEELGYTDLWTSEVNATDAFTPLVVAAMATSRTRLGTGIVNPFTRGPLTLAMHAASLNELAPGRVVLGLGSSSLPVVEHWNGVTFERPLSRMRDTLLVVRRLLGNETVSERLSTLEVRRAKYVRPVENRIPIYVAALRPNMLSLAGQTADGVIINLLYASDVPRVVKVVRSAARQAGRDPSEVEIVCRIFLCPSENRPLAPRRRQAIPRGLPHRTDLRGLPTLARPRRALPTAAGSVGSWRSEEGSRCAAGGGGRRTGGQRATRALPCEGAGVLPGRR
jgi:probable F420-dependent oxidoreductase